MHNVAVRYAHVHKEIPIITGVKNMCRVEPGHACINATLSQTDRCRGFTMRLLDVTPLSANVCAII